VKRKSVNAGGVPLLELPIQVTHVSSAPAPKNRISPKKVLPLLSSDFPYGQCRCGKAIQIPGLDGYKCSQCGWIAKILGGQR